MTSGESNSAKRIRQIRSTLDCLLVHDFCFFNDFMIVWADFHVFFYPEGSPWNKNMKTREDFCSYLTVKEKLCRFFVFFYGYGRDEDFRPYP